MYKTKPVFFSKDWSFVVKKDTWLFCVYCLIWYSKGGGLRLSYTLSGLTLIKIRFLVSSLRLMMKDKSYSERVYFIIKVIITINNNSFVLLFSFFLSFFFIAMTSLNSIHNENLYLDYSPFHNSYLFSSVHVLWKRSYETDFTITKLVVVQTLYNVVTINPSLKSFTSV